MTPSFWNNRRVLITGHTGFKGAWLSRWLQSLGAQVTGFALAPPPTPSLFQQARVADGMASHTGDVRDLDAVRGVVRESKPEILLHLAAQSLVRRSYAEPVDTFATNVMGTVHVLEAARGARELGAVVVVTSDKCYENREWERGYREDDAMGGHDPYSASKGCAELVTAAYRRSFATGATGPAVASARAGNVIGGGDWATDRLIPDLVRAFGAGAVPLLRNPLATRPWQHVLEPLRGYLALAEALCGTDGTAFAEGWNFGPRAGDTCSVATVADGVAVRWGAGARWALEPGAQPHEARALSLDGTKAGARLHWEPALSLATALDWTVQWYRDLAAGADAQELVARDVSAYTRACAAGIKT